MLKFVMAAATLVALVGSAEAQVRVRGYTNSNGTYVQPHVRSRPDGNTHNNYSTQGNVNPYTGAYGTTNPYGSNSTYGSTYGSRPSSSFGGY